MRSVFTALFGLLLAASSLFAQELKYEVASVSTPPPVVLQYEIEEPKTHFIDRAPAHKHEDQCTCPPNCPCRDGGQCLHPESCPVHKHDVKQAPVQAPASNLGKSMQQALSNPTRQVYTDRGWVTQQYTRTCNGRTCTTSWVEMPPVATYYSAPVYYTAPASPQPVRRGLFGRRLRVGRGLGVCAGCGG